MIALQVKTSAKQSFVNVTAQVQRAVRESGVDHGICVAFVPHTTAGITINESADPAVKEDVLSTLQKLVPEDARYRHLEGNSHAHVQASLMGSSVHIMIESGQLHMGTWQGVFFCEFDGPRTRELWVRCIASE